MSPKWSPRSCSCDIIRNTESWECSLPGSLLPLGPWAVPAHPEAQVWPTLAHPRGCLEEARLVLLAPLNDAQARPGSAVISEPKPGPFLQGFSWEIGIW